MTRARNQVRIVAGSARGRRINFPQGRGLRPTADRVRETLFNWLQGELAGRRVLDLFAGSGALGLEALSRGATEAVFVEQARLAADQLRKNLDLLGFSGQARVLQCDASRYLESATGPFDIIFLDPPFVDHLLGEICCTIEDKGLLAEDAWVYLEQDSHHPWPGLPDGWQVYREGRAGQAAFRLIQCNG